MPFNVLARRMGLRSMSWREMSKRKWDAANIRTVSTRLPIAMYHDLQRACRMQGMTVYAVMRELITMYLAAVESCV